MDGSVVVRQLGARMYYGVPCIFTGRERFALAGLAAFFNGLPSTVLPASVRRLVRRYSPQRNARAV